MTSSAVHNQEKMSAARAALYKVGEVREQVSVVTIQKLPMMNRMNEARATMSPMNRTRRSRSALPTRRPASDASRASSSALRRSGRGVTAL